MFARFVETQKSFPDRVREGCTDAGVLALAHYEEDARLARRLRDALETDPRVLRAANNSRFEHQLDPKKNLTKNARLLQQLTELREGQQARIGALLGILGSDPDWVFRVRNRDVGEFFVRTRADAVRELLPFWILKHGAKTRRAKARVEKMLESSIDGMLVPIYLGPGACTLDDCLRAW